jgi:hypothetical protein
MDFILKKRHFISPKNEVPLFLSIIDSAEWLIKGYLCPSFYLLFYFHNFAPNFLV